MLLDECDSKKIFIENFWGWSHPAFHFCHSDLRIFGFPEFLTTIALLMVVWMITDFRYKFRMKVSKRNFELCSLFFILFFGVCTLLTDFLRSKDASVVYFKFGNFGITPFVWQFFLSALFLGALSYIIYNIFIKKPIFCRKNSKKLATEVTSTIWTNKTDEIVIMCEEIEPIIKDVIKIISEGRNKSEHYTSAVSIFNLLGARSVCNILCAANPKIASLILNDKKLFEEVKYPVFDSFKKNFIQASIENENSFLNIFRDSNDTSIIEKTLNYDLFKTEDSLIKGSDFMIYRDNNCFLSYICLFMFMISEYFKRRKGNIEPIPDFFWKEKDRILDIYIKKFRAVNDFSDSGVDAEKMESLKQFLLFFKNLPLNVYSMIDEDSSVTFKENKLFIEFFSSFIVDFVEKTALMTKRNSYENDARNVQKNVLNFLFSNMTDENCNNISYIIKEKALEKIFCKIKVVEKWVSGDEKTLNSSTLKMLMMIVRMNSLSISSFNMLEKHISKIMLWFLSKVLEINKKDASFLDIYLGDEFRLIQNYCGFGPCLVKNGENISIFYKLSDPVREEMLKIEDFQQISVSGVLKADFNMSERRVSMHLPQSDMGKEIAKYVGSRMNFNIDQIVKYKEGHFIKPNELIDILKNYDGKYDFFSTNSFQFFVCVVRTGDELVGTFLGAKEIEHPPKLYNKMER